MFLTVPSFEQAFAAALLPAGGRAWRAVELSTRMPWFIVTSAIRDDATGERLLRDMLLSRGEDVAALLAPRSEDSVVGINYVEAAAPGVANAWQVRNVRRVWKVVDGTGPVGGALVFEDERGEFAEPLVGDALSHRGLRVLLAEFPVSGGDTES